MRPIQLILCSIALLSVLMACTLGQQLPETSQPTGNSATTSAPQINPPTDTPAPTPHIETVDDFFARCPTADEVARVNSDFKISFEYDPTAPTLVCHAADGSADLTALQKHAYQTIYVMHLLNFSQPLPWTDKQLYDWLVGAIDSIRFIDGGGSGYSFCCDPANTIVVALSSNAYIFLTDRWLEPSISGGLMNTMFLYVHEARHNEGYGHTCTSQSGDDNRVDEMGSWSVQYYLALWIAQYGDREFLKAPGSDPNLYRQMALDDSQITRSVRFCLDPAPPEPTLIP
ncbi:MAG: hypothetical protein HY258_11180 [Chloroflexi bacterium]|nr:hypothetical protein [Chloroflexota bacterium]